MGAVGRVVFYIFVFVVASLFICFFDKENLTVFQDSEIPNIEIVPYLCKNIEEKEKKQMGVTTTTY